MTIHSKIAPVGIDDRLLMFQTKLNNLSWTNTEVYGRLYITERVINKSEYKIAEAYDTAGEYKEIFIDDTKTAVFGFIVGDTISSSVPGIKVPVKMICSCNIDALYGSVERKDEETMLLVLKTVSSLLPGNEEKTINKKMADVFSEISYEKFKFRDMQPWFNFSISFNLSYSNSNC
jgi:hypothetical protein